MTFPITFKKLGLIQSLAAIVTLAIVKFFLQKDTPLFHIIIFDILLLGVVFFSFARERLEDERIATIRLKAWAGALFFAVIYTIILPILSVLFGANGNVLTAQELVLALLLMYNLFFYLLKNSDK